MNADINPWPNLNHILLRVESVATDYAISATALGAFIRIAYYLAAQSVHTYRSPRPPALPLARVIMARIAGLPSAEFESVWPEIAQAFQEIDVGHILRDAEIIHILPRGKVKRRKHEKWRIRLKQAQSTDRCAYCGNIEGPFHNDHLFPLSRGGTDDPSNIVTACAACNVSKGDKTLEEWICSRVVNLKIQKSDTDG